MIHEWRFTITVAVLFALFAAIVLMAHVVSWVIDRAGPIAALILVAAVTLSVAVGVDASGVLR